MPTRKRSHSLVLEEESEMQEQLHVRLHVEAMLKLRKVARQRGLRPSTWARIEIYRALGLIRADKRAS